MPESFTVLGLDELLEKLGSLPRGIDRQLARAQGIRKALLIMQRKAQVYPPAPPNSTYRRTGTLGRRWAVRVTATMGQVRGVLGNPTPYGPYVMDEEYQAEVHKGRWQTVQSIVEDTKDQIVAIFQGIIRRVLGS